MQSTKNKMVFWPKYFCWLFFYVMQLQQSDICDDVLVQGFFLKNSCQLYLLSFVNHQPFWWRTVQYPHVSFTVKMVQDFKSFTLYLNLGSHWYFLTVQMVARISERWYTVLICTDSQVRRIHSVQMKGTVAFTNLSIVHCTDWRNRISWKWKTGFGPTIFLGGIVGTISVLSYSITQ